jgi:hypothetical protein
MSKKTNFLKAIQAKDEWVIIDLNRGWDEADWYWSTEQNMWIDNAGDATRFSDAEKALFKTNQDMQWVNWTEIQRAMARSKMFHPTTNYREPRLSLFTDDSV